MSEVRAQQRQLPRVQASSKAVLCTCLCTALLLTHCQCMNCRQARETMVHRYAPSVVAELVVQRLRDIELHVNRAAA